MKPELISGALHRGLIRKTTNSGKEFKNIHMKFYKFYKQINTWGLHFLSNEN